MHANRRIHLADESSLITFVNELGDEVIEYDWCYDVIDIRTVLIPQRTLPMCLFWS